MRTYAVHIRDKRTYTVYIGGKEELVRPHDCRAEYLYAFLVYWGRHHGL